MGFPLTEIGSEREARLATLAQQGKGAKDLFKQCLRDNASGEAANAIRRATTFAENLDYNHPGLSPQTYLAHPIRMGCLALRFVKPADPDLVTVALLHNVLEVTDVSADELEEKFGSVAAESILDLTMDRSRKDAEYIPSYYGRLLQGHLVARIVKILDKLDNLFMLCLNPDAGLRERYLKEIEEWVVPMCRDSMPELTGYIEKLVVDCKKVGYTGNPYAETENQGATG